MKSPKNISLGLVLYGLLALNVGRAASAFDDFNRTQIDTSLWWTVTPFAGSSVSESNGRAVLIQRGILNSVAAFTDSVEIRGRFRFASSSDHFRIVFRSDQQPIDSFGELGGMIVVMGQDGEVQIGESDISTLALGRFPFVQNQDVDFRITDDGTNVSLFFNNANDPLLSASSAYRKGHKVSFYNREIAGTRVEVDSLQINSPILVQSWTNGLVAFYPFNGNVKDESGNGNDGVANNVSFAPDRFGRPNQASSFAGMSSSNVKINSTNLNLQPNFTVSVWINYTAEAGTEGPRIISTAGYEITTDSTFVTQRHINFDNTFSPGSGFAYVSSSKGVPAGVWTHIVGVRDSNTLNLYVDGSLAGAFLTALPPSYSRGFVPEIGGNSGANSDNYAGLIDDLRIYNRALSAEEVFQLYATESSIPCTPHAATATVQVVNGFVVGATITDPSCGYTNAPAVLIQGGSGSGATATAVVSGGLVTAINFTSAGCCYTSVPTIVIGSPPFVPTLSIKVSKVKVTQNVVLGRNYLLESSFDLVTWTAIGPQFTAGSETIVNEVDVDEKGRFFRIQQVP